MNLDDTITLTELSEVLMRNGFLMKPGATHFDVANAIFVEAAKLREPEYKDGGVYQDAYGEIWKFTTAGGALKGWLQFGSAWTAHFDSPKRPLIAMRPVSKTEPSICDSSEYGHHS
jgi:hypothetical protein